MSRYAYLFMGVMLGYLSGTDIHGWRAIALAAAAGVGVALGAAFVEAAVEMWRRRNEA